jgi:hypothetical protein
MFFKKKIRSNSKNTFGKFFLRQKKFGKYVSKYLFKGKNGNLGVEKKHGGWKEKNLMRCG